MIEPEPTQKAKESIKAEVQGISKEKKEILRSIYEATFDKSMSDTGRITMVISRFATLLVSLSEQTDSIQKKLIWLTRIIALLTVVLVLLTFIFLFKK